MIEKRQYNNNWQRLNYEAIKDKILFIYSIIFIEVYKINQF